MLASGGKILALGKVYHDNSLTGKGRPPKNEGDVENPLGVNENWVLRLVNENVSGATRDWVSAHFQPSGDYVTNDEFDGYKTAVEQKFDETVDWAEKTFQPSGDYASASDIKDWALKTEVAEEFHNTSAWADDTFVTNNTFNTYSADIHNELEQKFYTSAFSASFSSAFNQEFNTYIQSATSGWDHTDYSAGPGIKIEDHIVSLEPSAVPFDNYYTKDQTSGADQLSAAFNKYKEWSETSAWAEQTFIPQTASANWDLEKYSGFDGIKVENHWIGISADYVTPQGLATVLEPYAKTEALSAIPTLKSSDHSVAITSATSAGHVEYDLKVDKMPEIHISGERGISAQDLGDGNWLIGASADNLAYLYGSFSKNNSETVTSGSVIKFAGGIQKDITIDSDGFITVPDSVDKLTVCLNATIDNNIPQGNPHNYMLNQFVLSAVGGDALLTTHDYYPSEVGAADANLAATLQHVHGRKYCVVYLGSDALQQSHLDVNLSMIEEVISLSDNSGQATPYFGVDPIYVLNQNIGLNYDDDFFTLRNKTEGGITKPYLTLAQSSSGSTQPVDPEVFNKLLNSVNRRIVETIPIGILNDTDNQGDGDVRSYLFRPMIEFDMKSGTTARIRTYQKDASTKVQVSVFEVSDENAGDLYPIWFSEDKLLDKDKGEHILQSHPQCTEKRTIYPENLYYVLVKTRGGHVGLVGLENNIGHDTGKCDVAYYLTGQGGVEWTTSNLYNNISQLGSDGQPANFKPYVGFRNP